MHFELRQQFTSPPDAVDDAYADPDLYPTLVGLPKLGGIEVLSHERTGARASLRIRYRFTGDLPAAVTVVVEPARLTWVQETDHDLTSHRTTFRLLPDHYSDRLQASGAFRISSGRDGHGSLRVVEGDLKVRAMLVSGQVERAIVSGLDEYLQAEAPVVDRWLAGR